MRQDVGRRPRLDSNHDFLKERWAGLDLVCDAAKRNRQFLRLRVEQDPGVIYQGVCWNSALRSRAVLDTLRVGKTGG